MEADKKRDQIDMQIRMRKENRQRSVQEMIHRTREIAAGNLRPNMSSQRLPQDEQNTPEIRLTKMQKDKAHKQEDILRRNSQKYEDLMKERRDELKRKRGALDLNSDLDVDPDFRL